MSHNTHSAACLGCRLGASAHERTQAQGCDGAVGIFGERLQRISQCHWDIGRPQNGGKPAFVMTLNSDFSARKSHVPAATGTWKLVNGEARVVWSDGWRDIIRREGNRCLKIAFGVGSNFDSRPSNTQTAHRQ